MIPHGGIFLTAKQSALLAAKGKEDRDALILSIVSELRAQQRWRDKSSMTLLARQERRKARVADLRREFAELEGRP